MKCELTLSKAAPLRAASRLVAGRFHADIGEIDLKDMIDVFARGRYTFANMLTVQAIYDRVTLESDNKTEVMVYKVGRIGTFLTKTLELRPGAYTVTGKRRGYRDVRIQLVVEPGVIPGKPVIIRCEERI